MARYKWSPPSADSPKPPEPGDEGRRVEHARAPEKSFKIPQLSARFKLLAALALMSLLSSEPEPKAPEQKLVDVQDLPVVDEEDPRPPEEILDALLKKYPILATHKEFLLFSRQSFEKKLTDAKAARDAASVQIEKLQKKGRPKNKTKAAKYDKELGAWKTKQTLAQASLDSMTTEVKDLAAINQDPETTVYLEKISYPEMLRVGAIRSTDELESFDYLNVEGLWERKVSITSPGRNRDMCVNIQKNGVPNREVEKFSYENMHDRIKAVIDELEPHAGELGFKSEYLNYLDVDTLMAIVLQELMPAEYHAVAKVQVFRSMLDEGFEPEWTPAVHDTSASYGPYQMTLKTQEGHDGWEVQDKKRVWVHHKGIRESYQEILSQIQGLSPTVATIRSFESSTDLESQTLATYLLTLDNHELFYKNFLKRNETFKRYFDNSSEAERKIFFSSIAGFIHNAGFSKTFTDPMNNKDNPIFDPSKPDDSLEDAYARFLENAVLGSGEKAAIARRYIEGVGNLMPTVIAYSVVDHPYIYPSPPGEIASVDIGPAPKAAREVRSSVLMSRPIHGKDAYTFSIPNWKLDRVMTALTGSPAGIDELKTYNNTKHFSKDDTVYFPVESLKPELRDAHLTSLEIKDGKDADALLDRILKPEKWSAENKDSTKDAIFILSNESAWDGWDNIEGFVRIPSEWIDQDALQRELGQASPAVASAEPVVPKSHIFVTGEPERVSIYEVYSPLRDRAIKDGYPISSDRKRNRALYEAALVSSTSVDMPLSTPDYFRKPNPDSIAKIEQQALVVFEHIAREFKIRTGGYMLAYTDILRTPEYQDKMSPIDDSTHYTGRTLDIPDGRFRDPSGREMTWSVKKTDEEIAMLPKNHKSIAEFKRSPDADQIEKMRPILIQILEEYQAEGWVMAFDETKSGGHWHLYFPKQNKTLYSPDEAAARVGVTDIK